MYIKVHMVPSARKEKVERINDTTYAIAVREPAQRNLANRRVTEILQTEYGVEKNAVRLVSGHRGPHKIFDIDLSA